MTIKLCLIGAGNITNSRHIPAVKKNSGITISGIISTVQKDVENTANKHRIENRFVLNDKQEIKEQLKNLDWSKNIDAVMIGTPPMHHFSAAKASLELGRHVLVEKPMVMHSDEATELIDLANRNGKQLCVMHNFQFATNFLKMEDLISKGEIGEVLSVSEMQMSNRTRRLPSWYNELPLGLFYDEAAHFLYLLEKVGGPTRILDVFPFFNPDKNVNTPDLLSVNLKAGKIPTNLFINFNAPICEWFFTVSGSKKLAIYDFFRDILITIPNDKLHLAKNVLSNSFHFTWQHWIGTFTNGIKMLSGNLLYGHDIVVSDFIKAIETNKKPEGISGEDGLKNVQAMHSIIRKALEHKDE
ncbi:Gfo/Idh/MocA family oxidoreductase [Patescibacteria group bacterium]|nr:Gfo/Idh/MocA family oxidoreductase [Patescibacteria group bacterium]